MKRHILFLLALLLSLSSSYGQSIITGHVRTLQGAPVEYARVLALVPTDSTILAYTFTDALGSYRLSVSSTQPQLLISVASMEIERMDRRVENVSQTCDFRVKESRTLLREVQVKARKIWGKKDTVNYSVGAFIGKNDVVIADVLRKLPNIEVSVDGFIKYQGKPINKFYIEGQDPLGSNYTQASRNIPINAVDQVDVRGQEGEGGKARPELRPADPLPIRLQGHAGREERRDLYVPLPGGPRGQQSPSVRRVPGHGRTHPPRERPPPGQDVQGLQKVRLSGAVGAQDEVQSRPPVRAPYGLKIPKSSESGALESHLKAPRVEKRKGENWKGGNLAAFLRMAPLPSPRRRVRPGPGGAPGAPGQVRIRLPRPPGDPGDSNGSA